MYSTQAVIGQLACYEYRNMAKFPQKTGYFLKEISDVFLCFATICLESKVKNMVKNNITLITIDSYTKVTLFNSQMLVFVRISLISVTEDLEENC